MTVRSILWSALISTVAFVPSQGVLPPTADAEECSALKEAERFDCYPEPGVTEQGCIVRGCCWITSAERLPPISVPSCFYPKNYGSYKYAAAWETVNGLFGLLERVYSSAYPDDADFLIVDAEYQTENRVHVKISEAQNPRYETLYPKLCESVLPPPVNRSYEIIIDQAVLGFQVKRSSGEVLFNTQNLGGFIFSDQFLQISSTFSGTIYGLGEHRTNLSLDTNWSRYTMFTHDTPPKEGLNLYGSHPFYLVVEPNGQSHGVYLHNSNAMDVLLQPLDAITFRPIGGILDFYFFMGPSPSDVISQYTELIGRPFLPPYWSLGFHLCKYGYDSADVLRGIWQRNVDAEVPFDVQWIDYDYMIEHNIFTLDPNFGDLPGLIDDIHARGMHFVPIVDPGMSGAEPPGTYPPYDDGLAADIFIKNLDDTIFLGKVWNTISTVFPDFTNPKALEFWTKQLKEFHEKLEYDGIWIDMNEPANFLNGSFDGCPQNSLEFPPYYTGVESEILSRNTICMSTKQYAGSHYNVHNLYGISEAEVTNLALREVLGKRPFVLSRSTFAGSGRYTGHWSGDDESTWYDLVKSIPEILTFGLYGVSFVGADICGFREGTTETLCNRWAQLGAFYSFARNHNGQRTVEQDPAAFGKETQASIKKALNVRYTLLPYLYTLLYRSHVSGETVARPLFFEFPEDSNTHQVDTAFLWGSGLFIIPVLTEGATSVSIYLPAGTWYDWYSQAKRQSAGEIVTLDAPLDTIPLLIRGGVVLPTQAPAVTTTLSRKNPFTYIAAGDEKNEASGTLFWDDGDSIDTVENNQFGLLNFQLKDSRFTSNVVQWTTSDTPLLESVRVLGVSKNVTQVTVNGKLATFNLSENVLSITGIGTSLDEDLEIVWS